MSDQKPRLNFGVENILGIGEPRQSTTFERYARAGPQPGSSGLSAHSEDSNEGKSQKSRTTYCNRCRNHGQVVPYKGHKNVCPVWDCVCEACVLITQRHRVNKKLAALEKNRPDN